MSLEILPNGSDEPDDAEDRPVDDRPISEVLQSLSNGPVRATDVARMSDLDRAAFREVTRAWNGLPEETRIAIVQQMDQLAEERVDLNFSRALRPALNDDSDVVRQLAVGALWEDISTDLMDRLLTILSDDPSEDVRAEAAKALGRFADLAAEGELSDERADLLRSRLLDVATDPEVAPVIRRRATESVGAFGKDEDVREALESAYGSEDQSMQASAIFGMGRSQDTYWLDLLIGELSSAEAELRFEAARACGQLASDAAVPDLIATADDDDMEVRHAVFTALGQIGGKASIRALERFAEAAEEADEEADAAVIAEALEEARTLDDPLGDAS